MQSHDVIKYPTMTERSVYMIENENKLVFIVHREATKSQIAAAIKDLYEVEAKEINTLIDRQGEKKAFIKLKEGFSASEVAIKLGIL
ncbi:TPA: 50S ribosomal protein L23 [Candidatus Bathyarchaeota archaeon]|nr:50S ribosomal protein L23 [Candidatus Bathyarchaeota archaeon]